ncbi:MAG: glycosyltransferase [Patescibacteria group bacterium]
MKVSLVIPAYNEEAYIGACIEAALRLDSFSEIIVVDNASTDNTALAAGRYDRVRVVREEEKGTNAARARGLLEATGEFVAFVDADTHVPADWLIKAEREFQKSPHVVALSGPYAYYDGSGPERLFMSLVWWFSAPLTYRVVGYMILGGNFIARKSALLAMGGFDKRFLFYGDDTDIARRLSGQGKVVFKMDFKGYSSLRRFRSQGFVRTSVLYGLNFLWPVLFRKPYTAGHGGERGAVDAATLKAIAVSLLFFCGGVLAWSAADPTLRSVPLGVFYTLLVFNTFFSVRLFSRVISPTDPIQILVDLGLCFLYAGLVLSFTVPAFFLLITAFLFVVATAKYAFLLGKIDHPKLLKRKILVDLLGAFGALGTLIFFSIEKGALSLWIFAIGFAIANFLLFTVWPLYRLDTEVS